MYWKVHRITALEPTEYLMALCNTTRRGKATPLICGLVIQMRKEKKKKFLMRTKTLQLSFLPEGHFVWYLSTHRDEDRNPGVLFPWGVPQPCAWGHPHLSSDLLSVWKAGQLQLRRAQHWPKGSQGGQSTAGGGTLSAHIRQGIEKVCSSFGLRKNQSEVTCQLLTTKMGERTL